MWVSGAIVFKSARIRASVVRLPLRGSADPSNGAYETLASWPVKFGAETTSRERNHSPACTQATSAPTRATKRIKATNWGYGLLAPTRPLGGQSLRRSLPRTRSWENGLGV